MGHRSSFGSTYRKRRRDGTEYDGWYVRFVEASRRVERFGGLTKNQAETYLAARRFERSEMRALGLPQIRRVKLKDAVDEYRRWLREHRRPNTASGYGATLQALAVMHGARDVVSLRPEDLAQLLDGLRRDRDYLPSSLLHSYSVLSSFCRWSVEKRYASFNATRGLRGRLPRLDVEEPPYLSVEEMRLIYAAVPPEIRPIVVLWGEAGLRSSEARTLRWGELRPDLSAVMIPGKRSKGHKGRTVHLTEFAREALRALPPRSLLGDEPIFVIHRTTLENQFRRAMEKLGRHDVTPKTLRHAFGSRFTKNGGDIEVLRRLMGHRNISTTQIYACHRPGNAGELAIRAMEKADSHVAAPARREAAP